MDSEQSRTPRLGGDANPNESNVPQQRGKKTQINPLSQVHAVSFGLKQNHSPLGSILSLRMGFGLDTFLRLPFLPGALVSSPSRRDSLGIGGTLSK